MLCLQTTQLKGNEFQLRIQLWLVLSGNLLQKNMGKSKVFLQTTLLMIHNMLVLDNFMK